jgi:hypothetical protein
MPQQVDHPQAELRSERIELCHEALDSPECGVRRLVGASGAELVIEDDGAFGSEPG